MKSGQKYIKYLKGNIVMRKAIIWMTLFILSFLGLNTEVMAANEAPVLKVNNESITSIKCSWSSSEKAKGYRLRLYDNNGKYITSYYTSKTTYIVSDLTPGKTYYFDVASYVRDKNNKAVYSKYSSKKKLKAIPATVNLSVKSIGRDSYSIKWSEIKDADYYVVYSYDDVYRTYTRIAITTDLEYIFKDICEGVSCDYVVRAFSVHNKIAYASDVSNVITAGTLPETVKIKSGVISDNSIVLKWNEVSGADFYRIYMYDENTQKNKLVKTVYECETTLDSLSSGTNYRLLVRSGSLFNKKGYTGGKNSNVLNITTRTKQPQVNATILENNNIELSWDAVKGVDGYYVKIYDFKEQSYKLLADIKENKYVYPNENASIEKKFIVQGYMKTTNSIHNGMMSESKFIYTNKEGIDVSKWQGKIDWAKVKKAGIDFAIIKIGGRSRKVGTISADPTFTYNIEQATKYGIRVGVYFYSTAISIAEAKEEADWVCNKIKKLNLDLPIVFDYEDYVISSSRCYSTTVVRRTNYAKAFLDRVKGNGHNGMMYGNQSALKEEFNMDKLSDYSIWVARYGAGNKGKRYEKYRPNIGREYAIWQYSETGRVSGIDEYVDMNYCYKLII